MSVSSPILLLKTGQSQQRAAEVSDGEQAAPTSQEPNQS